MPGTFRRSRANMTTIGVDLKTSPKRPSIAIVLDDDLRLVCWRPIATDSELLQTAETNRPIVKAIGAPAHPPCQTMLSRAHLKV